MAEKIRTLTDRDFFKISALFNFSKTVEELKWLFRDPNNPDNYNGLVVLNDKGRLVGVIGYVVSAYYDGKKTVNGVIPMSWKIISGYKGFAGILLMRNALSKGDFAFTIGGTKAALALYPMFKLDYIFTGYKFYKIFNPFYFLLSLQENLLRRIAKTLILMPAYLRGIKKNSIYNDIEFHAFTNNSTLSNHSYSGTGIFQKQISYSYVKWLLDCPILTTFCFNVSKGNENLGLCIFLINEINNIKRGRIVYLPFLGENMKLWKSVLYKSFEFFKTQGCCSVSAFATNKIAISGYSTVMTKFVKSQKIFLKDSRNKLKDVKIADWNIQFAEGDTVYLNI